MIKFFVYIVLLVWISSCVSLAKSARDSQKEYREYIENKNEISSKVSIRNYSEFISKIDLKNGDIVADVGAADGYIDLMLSQITDSVTYYIQDISKENLNAGYFDSLYKYVNVSKKISQSNKFNLVLGTERNSLLPDTTFDKIFLFNSMHEFTYIKYMLDDLYKKLKYNGKIIIRESLSEDDKKHIISGCSTASFTKNEIVKIMIDSKFNPNYQLYSDSTFENVLIFSKN